MTGHAPRGKMRVQKFLSDAGVASRRHAEELVLDGRVLVNDEIVTGLPAFVDPDHDVVVVDGTPVRIQAPVYFLVHKPPGVVCTHHDPAGRTRAVDLLPPLRQRLFPVGRLDEDSSGLLLMTNDGELAEQVTHPRFGFPKVYRATVRGRVSPDLPEQLKRGVYLAEGKARASEVEIVRATNKETTLTITLREGRNRQVRRMLARLGHPVRRLVRLQIGPLTLKGLPVGAARELRPHELRALREAVAAAKRRSVRRPRASHPRSIRDGAAARAERTPARPGSGPPRAQRTQGGPAGGRRLVT